MSEQESTERERVLASILRAPDPGAALARAVADPSLSRGLRDLLREVDPDGLRLSALLVARLRFERLMQGSPEAAAWFESDAAGFSRAFRRYHDQVAPTAFFPTGEAVLFRRWCERDGSVRWGA